MYEKVCHLGKELFLLEEQLTSVTTHDPELAERQWDFARLLARSSPNEAKELLEDKVNETWGQLRDIMCAPVSLVFGVLTCSWKH